MFKSISTALVATACLVSSWGYAETFNPPKYGLQVDQVKSVAVALEPGYSDLLRVTVSGALSDGRTAKFAFYLQNGDSVDRSCLAMAMEARVRKLKWLVNYYNGSGNSTSSQVDAFSEDPVSCSLYKGLEKLN